MDPLNVNDKALSDLLPKDQQVNVSAKVLSLTVGQLNQMNMHGAINGTKVLEANELKQLQDIAISRINQGLSPFGAPSMEIDASTISEGGGVDW